MVRLIGWSKWTLSSPALRRTKSSVKQRGSSGNAVA
jgi:hypothetical protein